MKRSHSLKTSLFSLMSSIALGLFLAACSSTNGPPTFQPLTDQVGTVGVELSFQLRATDPDGDSLRFDFFAPELPDLKTRVHPATITSFADGVGLFRWTPTALDRNVAAYTVDFSVSDGHTTLIQSVRIAVNDSAVAAPVFRRPLGNGTNLDLTVEDCIEVPILVEDSDSVEVTVRELPPLIEGATLTQDAPFEALWRWCPSEAQAAQQSRYTVNLAADDGSGSVTNKSYLIVLDVVPKMNCPGAAPVISHTQLLAQSTVQDISVAATITDDHGLKGEPLIYYSTTAPASPPVLATMTQLSMTRLSGTATSGTYEAALPNPVASLAAGTTQTVYYLIVADDNDDASGNCDHSTSLPATASYSFTVTNPGTTMSGLGVCEACTSDIQCGGLMDHCIHLGIQGMTYCSQACGGSTSAACPTGYTCSTAAVTSVGGTVSRQCVPTSGSCTPMMMTSCTEDSMEENDSQSMIVNTQANSLAAGTYNLALCPTVSGYDEDWFRIPLTSASNISVALESLVGVDYSDVDVQLRAAPTSGGAMGTLLASSASATESESLSYCAPSGTSAVYIRVLTTDAIPVKPNLYDMTVTKTAVASCCTDAREPNDNHTQSTIASSGAAYSNLQICAGGDQDWFRVSLNAGQRLTARMTLRYPQATGAYTDTDEDLDLHLFRAVAGGSPTDLTPCSPTSVTCSSTNGQGSTTNETMMYTVPTGQTGTYYVVVKPYDGGTNTYDLTLTVQ